MLNLKGLAYNLQLFRIFQLLYVESVEKIPYKVKESFVMMMDG